jgi:hypothetical protein
MASIRQWLLESFHLTGKLLKSEAFWLGIVFIISGAFGILSEDILKQSSTTSSNWQLQVLMAVTEFVEAILVLLILARGVSQIRKFPTDTMIQNPFSPSDLKSFFSEYLRMLAQILFFTVLLIIPGLIRYVQLIFVPFVALFSREYRDGKWDAIEASKTLMQGQYARLVGILILGIGLGLAVEFAPHILDWNDYYAVRILSLGLSDLISVWMFAVVFLLFEARMVGIEKDKLNKPIHGEA